MSEVTTIPVTAGSLATLRELAAGAPTSLLWLLDPSATPSGDALAALLEHAPGPAASLPVNLAGDVVEALMGRITESDAPGILDAVGRHRLPLRHTYVTSLLVERDVVLELDPPDPARFGCYAGPEWTARLFARGPGWLVPGSRVRVSATPAGSPLEVLRAARSARWRKGETLRELHRAVTGGIS
jgi:hypothetical protein